MAGAVRFILLTAILDFYDCCMAELGWGRAGGAEASPARLKYPDNFILSPSVSFGRVILWGGQRRALRESSTHGSSAHGLIRPGAAHRRVTDPTPIKAIILGPYSGWED